MADNVTIPASGTGTSTPDVATDDVNGAHFQRIKLDYGVDGETSPAVSNRGVVDDGTARVTLEWDQHDVLGLLNEIRKELRVIRMHMMFVTNMTIEPSDIDE